MGEGFTDFYEWHLKTQVEGAKQIEPSAAPPPPRQLWLAGMKSTGNYEFNLFKYHQSNGHTAGGQSSTHDLSVRPQQPNQLRSLHKDTLIDRNSLYR